MRYSTFGVIGEIDNLPGCSQVAVFHSVFCPKELRGKGLGYEAHKERLKEAKRLGYNMAMCTVVLGNVKQESILKQHHWKQVATFDSTKTGNAVGVWVILL